MESSLETEVKGGFILGLDQRIREDRALSSDDEHIEAFKKELLEQQDKFEHIFITEAGSVYFTESDGSSLRIAKFTPEKHQDRARYGGSNWFLVHRPMRHILFISEEESARLRRIDKQEWLKNESEIKTVPFGEGAWVLEIDSLRGLSITQAGGKAVIANTSDFSFPATHFGHPITEVIK